MGVAEWLMGAEVCRCCGGWRVVLMELVWGAEDGCGDDTPEVGGND